DEVLEAIELPETRIGRNQMPGQVVWRLVRKPGIWWGIAFTTRPILLSGQQHAVCQLVAVSLSITQDIHPPRVWVLRLQLAKDALREDVINLRKVVGIRRCVGAVNVAVPQIEQKMNRIGTVTQLPQP